VWYAWDITEMDTSFFLEKGNENAWNLIGADGKIMLK